MIPATEPRLAPSDPSRMRQLALLVVLLGCAACVKTIPLSAAIEPWRLGHHPAPGALLRHAQERHLSREVLEQAGLLRNGREIFAGRVMFPIDDERGRTVGFGGRLVPGAPGIDPDVDFYPPKYLNSPDSPFFS